MHTKKHTLIIFCSFNINFKAKDTDSAKNSIRKKKHTMSESDKHLYIRAAAVQKYRR